MRWMFVREVDSHTTQVCVASQEYHLQLVIVFLEMNILPMQVMKVLPAITIDNKGLTERWTVLWSHDELDFLPAVLSRNTNANVVAAWLFRVEFIKDQLFHVKVLER